MATLTATLALTSTDATSESLGLTVTDALSTTNPAISVARQTIATSGQTNILTTSSCRSRGNSKYCSLCFGVWVLD